MLQSMEYIFSDDMLKLLDNFTSLTGVRMAFLSLDGEELCVGESRRNCSYCALRRNSYDFNEACLADKQRGRAVSLEKNDVHFYRCHAGLCQVVMPFRNYGGAVIGYAMMGQFLLAGFSAEAQNYNELQALERLPLFTLEQLDDLLGMFKVLIHYIANHALFVRQDLDQLSSLVERMRNDPAESLKLTEAASYVKLSTSRLSHLFKATMGVSFKQYQITQRLELADRLLMSNPRWRIARVAKACGFDDPLYFSRVYKDHRGIPPSKAMKKIA